MAPRERLGTALFAPARRGQRQEHLACQAETSARAVDSNPSPGKAEERQLGTNSDRLAKATADSLQAAAIGIAARARSGEAYKNARWSLATPRDCAGVAAAAQADSIVLTDAPRPLDAGGTGGGAPTPAPPRTAAHQIPLHRSCAALGAGERRRFAAVQALDKRAPIQPPTGDRRVVPGLLHVGMSRMSPTARASAPASSRRRVRLTAKIMRDASHPESPKAAAQPVVGRCWLPVTIWAAGVMHNTAHAEPAARNVSPCSGRHPRPLGKTSRTMRAEQQRRG